MTAATPIPTTTKPTPRTASSPRVGALRDALRTTLAIGLGLLVAHFAGNELADKLDNTIAGFSAVVISAAFAWVGKTGRDSTTGTGILSALGKVI